MTRDILSIPARDFGPAPWWAWLGEMTTETIDRNLRRFQSMDIHELIVIPLYGLCPEYLGREYFDLFRHACRRCEEWGVKLWIYDEFNWPSGTCAGRVIREFPQYRQRAIEIRPNGKGAKRRSLYKIEVNERFQLAAYGAEWAVPTTGYLDTLNPKAARAFLEMTHEAYRREVGAFFGKVILGFFTDEPVVNFGVHSFPYTPGLFGAFKKKFGYDLRPRLSALVEDRPDAARTRRDYRALVAELFRKNFIRPYAEWCAARDLKMTGHLLHEESLEGGLVRSGDLFSALSEMQTPGIDLLRGLTSFDNTDDGRYEDRDITGKTIESVAYFASRKRSLCEAFGCMPNSATAQDYKRAADFLFHHGVSLINDNMFADSLSGFRKFCGGHAFATPWTRHYRLFARHVRAMSYLNSESRLDTNVGVYYPWTDAAARYVPPKSMRMGPYYAAPDWTATQRTLHDLAHGLVRRHWDYYLVFDPMLSGGEAGPDGLRVRDFRCRVLIFPDVHYLSWEVAPVLRRFVEMGGAMICLGRVPAVLEQDGRTRPGEWGDATRVIEIRTARSEMVSDTIAALAALLQSPLPLDGPGASEVMATRRLTRFGETVFLTNFGDRVADIRLELPGEWRKVDTVMATMGEAYAGGARLSPNESVLLLRSAVRRGRAKSDRGQQTTILFRDEWELRLPVGNTLSLPMEIYTGRRDSPPRRARGNCWTLSDPEQAVMDLTPERAYWLRREIDIDYQPDHLELIVDGHDTCEVFINRHPAPTARTRTPLWDDDNLVCDLRRTVCRGRNEILVRYTPARIRRFVSRMVPLSDLPPFALRGNFLVASCPDRPDVTPTLTALPGAVQTGALNVRGYPCFAGVAEYRQTLCLEKPNGPVVLDMGYQRDLFEIEVNDRAVGVLGWSPYRLDVGACLKPGENRFVFRLYTAMGGILNRYYKGIEKRRPPVGMQETPVLRRQTKN